MENSVVVQSLSRVQLFVIPWTAARQAPLCFTISWNLFTFMSIESVMLYNHLILCAPFSFCLQSFPAWGSFPISLLCISGGQSFGISASASVRPMNIRENSIEDPQKTKYRVAVWPNNPTPEHTPRQNYNSKRYMNPNVHSSTIHS